MLHLDKKAREVRVTEIIERYEVVKKKRKEGIGREAS